MTEAAVRERALDYLARHNVMTLATSGAEGPWAAAVFYVNDGFELFFLSSPGSRHSRDIAVNAKVAATVQEDYAGWLDIKGVQLEGAVAQIEGAEEARVRGLYGSKFPLVGDPAAAPAAIAAAFAKVRWYRLLAARAYFVDNSAGFGHRDQVL